MRPISIMLATGLAALLTAGLFVTRAAAIDLTGTWIGSETCTLITASGDKDSTGKVKNLTLQISQDAGDPSLHHMLFLETGRRYNGIVLDEFNSLASPLPKAIATFASCPTKTATIGAADLPLGSEMVSANFTFGTLDKLAHGVSLVFAEDGSQQSCTWTTFKRTDTTDPLIGPCP